ncbi:hypothetical protein [uncultured Succinivibrio sp.]|uniref:hypothetical protein n=1 Tax=uncultured Succinivibrio sp. TaxID=540749 RepID=UPI0025E51C52|nr:hypothetical protein [uncultured Succinivibrio sp.]
MTKAITDHLGNEFKGVRAMYLHYGLNESIYYQRKRQGQSLEKILTTPVRLQKNSCLDDTLVYKRHQISKKKYEKKAIRLKSEVSYKTEHGKVTVREYWRG